MSINCVSKAIVLVLKDHWAFEAISNGSVSSKWLGFCNICQDYDFFGPCLYLTNNIIVPEFFGAYLKYVSLVSDSVPMSAN